MVVNLVGYNVCIFDDVGAEGDTDDDIVGDEPEGVVETDVVWMRGRDGLPVCFTATESYVLDWPVAELL